MEYKDEERLEERKAKLVEVKEEDKSKLLPSTFLFLEKLTVR
jgi:hypothetical protein